jgi:hypothetical protein
MIRNQLLAYLCSFILGQTCLFSQALESKPTAIFSAVFWDRFTSKSITYAPWGNHDDQNATKITLQVGFSTPSQPIAYYGKSPIRFFETIFLEDGNEEGSYTEKIEELCEFSFEQDSSITKDLFLIFLKQKNQSKFKTFSLPLSQDSFEYGSFICYSQYKEPLYLAYGNQKQVLGSGNSVKFKQDEKGNNEPVQLKVFKRLGAKYEEVASDYLVLSPTRRSLGFLAPNRNRVRLKRYYFNRTPIESSIGYNSVPYTELLANDSEDNSTDLLGSQ